MPTFISPGVYTTIIDMSLYVPNLATTILGLVGCASKGPTDEATYISDVMGFVTAFGNPNPNYMAPYAALQFLRYGRQLYFIRVAGSSAAKAAVALKENTTTGTVTAGVPGPYLIRSAANDTLRVKIDAGSFVAVTLTKGVRTASQVASDISTAIGAGATVTVNPDQTITITSATIGSGGITIDTFGNGSTANATLGFASGAYVGVAATAGMVQGVGVNQNYNIVTGANDKLDIVIDGDIYNVTLSAGSARAAADIAGDINTVITTHGTASAQTVGGNVVVRVISATTGTSSIVQVLGTSTSAATLGFDTAVHIGSAATKGGVAGTVAGPFAIGINNTLHLRFNAGQLRVVALSSGLASASAIAAAINIVVGPAGYNEGIASVTSAGALAISTLVAGSAGSVQVDAGGTGQYAFNFSTASQGGTGDPAITTVTVTALTVGTYGNNLKIVAATPTNGLSGYFQLLVYDGTYLAERWDNLNKTPMDPNYVETKIKGNSAYISVADNTGSAVVPALSYTSTMAGGDDGISTVGDADYIGVDSPEPTGLQIFYDAESFDLNLVAVPGISSAAVINESLLLSSVRGDCMALVDPPLGLNVQQVVDWHNGAGNYGDHQAFNTFYGALYWPWVQIFDPVNRQDVWVPPSGLVAGVYAYTDYTTETWFAPAGYNRGHLIQPLKLERNSNRGDWDLMYGNQNSVNPIVNFRKQGITVWGQRSLQRAPTALDRVNVVRLILYLRKVIATATGYLVFEPNDTTTWNTFVRTIEPYMESVKQRRGVYDYKVICDATTNPPDAIDRNEMHGVVALQPEKAAEFIEVKFVLTPTGANFADLNL